ncbi:type II toxin-antitoxin system PemK/MazF family toxin [Candidatus Desulfofervidus auxilii]|uniref:type II toxin-antitoxin system PemK/MazF family toxin n=1 Tax=Desulfofervidus auxilii TaxID=1621989 RepID=UPI00248040A4|nr:type II toxin-antitoxin system PemK/MazF family toxin [Candidatus Desulfofervidus auxilii]
MVPSKSYQFNKELDEIITLEDKDFQESGLKTESVIRVSRLAVVEKDILIGRIGKISSERLKRIKDKLGKWIME